MTWGQLQKECHKLLEEVFESKGEAYIWLEKEFKIHHFADLKYKDDLPLLEKIYEKLYVKSLLT